jgi:hypothetical protein
VTSFWQTQFAPVTGFLHNQLQSNMTYRAIRVHHFGAPDQMKVEDMEEQAPAAGQVLVAVKAAGVNPVDTYIR